MRQIVYLTAGLDGHGPIYAAVLEAARETGYSVVIGNSVEGLRAGWMPSTGSAGDLITAFRASDLVIAHVSRRNQNLFFEVGVAAGAGKPVVLIVRKADVLPFDLRTMPLVSYEPKNIDSRRIAFSLREIIINLREQGPYPQGSIPLKTVVRPNPPADFLKEGRALRDRISPLISSIEGWDVQTAATADANESFDFVVWNNNRDARLLPLGNPIAVELK